MCECPSGRTDDSLVWRGMEIEMQGSLDYSERKASCKRRNCVEPFRFLHTADLHLGTPFRGLDRKLPPEWHRRLQEASYHVMERIVEVAIREQVEFVTMAGDLFDAAVVPMSVQFELRRGFERLAEHGIHVFVSHGNHDPRRGSAPVHWPDNVHVFAAAPLLPPSDYAVPAEVFQTRSRSTVQVSGFSYGQAEFRQSLAAHFVRQPSVDFAIGLYHGAVGSSQGHENYCPATIDDFRSRGFDLWGLGHIHQRSVLSSDGPVIFYPGNPQGRHVREAGVRGVYLVDVDRHRQAHLHFVPTASVVWHICQISAEDAEDLAVIRWRALEVVQQEVRAEVGDAHLVRLKITGTTSLHSQLFGQEATLQATLQEDLNAWEPPVWLESIDVHTQPQADVEALRHSQEFIGEVLRRLARLRAEPERAREELGSVLTEVFHPGFGLDLKQFSDTELADWLTATERLLLQYAEPAEVSS